MEWKTHPMNSQQMNFWIWILSFSGILIQLATASPSLLYSPTTVSENNIQPWLANAGPGSHPTSSTPLPEPETPISAGVHPVSLTKRDVEKEADSANGKTPFYLFKKDFYHPNARRFLIANANKKADLLSPFATKFGGPRYQRYRRSSAMNQDVRGLLDMLAAKQGSSLANYKLLNGPVANALSENEGTLDVPIDLGYYGPPTELEKYEDEIPLSLDELDLDAHIRENPGAYGLYFSPEEEKDQWLDEPVSLQDHMKTRRSDSSYFRANPVKSHFRRYQRSLGKFGPIYSDM